MKTETTTDLIAAITEDNIKAKKAKTELADFIRAELVLIDEAIRKYEDS